MGKSMTAGKVKGDSLTRLKRQIKQEVQAEAIEQCMCVFLAYMMEEEGYTEPEKLCEMWCKCDEWLGHINSTERLLSVSKVKKIIQEHTGIRLHPTRGGSYYKVKGEKNGKQR